LRINFAKKMHMAGHDLKGKDFGVVCCIITTAFLVLAYIPMPEGRGFTLDPVMPLLAEWDEA